MRVRLAPRGQLTLRSEPIFPLYFKQPLVELAHQLLDRLILGGTRFGPAFAVAPPPLSDDERQEQEGNEPEDELVRYAAGKPCRGVVIAVDGTPPNKEAVLAQPRRAGRARNRLSSPDKQAVMAGAATFRPFCRCRSDEASERQRPLFTMRG